MALMSPWESLIQTLGMQKDWAASSVIFNAMASARRGEEIESHHDDPWICCPARSQWMTHPKPAVSESFFHAASELQGVTSGGKCVGGWHKGGTWWSGLQDSWATSHSLAPLIVFVITVLAEICRFSKNRLFLAVQMFQHIQEKMSELIPVGGRRPEKTPALRLGGNLLCWWDPGEKIRELWPKPVVQMDTPGRGVSLILFLHSEGKQIYHII